MMALFFGQNTANILPGNKMGKNERKEKVQCLYPVLVSCIDILYNIRSDLLDGTPYRHEF